MCPLRSRTSLRARGGLTLVEMLLAISILGITAGTLTGLALSVQQGTSYSQGYSTATQHARVSMERVTRTVSQAYATGNYPGAVVVYDAIGSWQFSDTLLVWSPKGAPANPSGPPLLGELVIYCPDPANPNHLLEVTAPGSTVAVPFNAASLNTTAWRTQIKSLASGGSGGKSVLLTELVRSAQYNASTVRAAVRFVADLRPTDNEWTACQTQPSLWSSLSWPQGLGGAQTGVRHVAVRVELQMLPDSWSGLLDPQVQQTVPFLGSSALSYTLVHP